MLSGSSHSPLGFWIAPLYFRLRSPRMAFALKPRKFYLSPFTIQKLGGPQAAEIMRLMIDEKLQAEAIREKLQLSEAEYASLTESHVFKKELRAQLKLREGDEKFRKQRREAAKALAERSVTAPAQRGSVLQAVPPLPVVNLKRGESPVDWVLRRINEVTPQAVERLVWLMTNARQENVQYNAATKLLGLNGIVEVEKSISVIADAEAIIRELNKRGPYRRKTSEELEAELVETISVEEQPAESPGDSGAGTTPPPIPTEP